MAKKKDVNVPAVEKAAEAIDPNQEERVDIQAIGTSEKEKIEKIPGANLTKKAAELFSFYPKAKTLRFTSDGIAFFELSDAANHANSLPDKKVITINREEV